MDRPEARNAMNAELSEQLAQTYDVLEADDDVWAVVVTGAGDRAFCAGADLKEVVAHSDAGTSRPTRRGGFGGLTERDYPKPVIVAVNGFALGGGFELCMACDLIVAEEHATFGLPEVKRGIYAGARGLVRIGQRLPMSLALEVAMTGEPLTAQRAYALGLVNRVVPQGEGVRAAVELGNVICQAAPLSVRLSKRVVRTTFAQGEDEALVLQNELGAQLREAMTGRRARARSWRSGRPRGRAVKLTS